MLESQDAKIRYLLMHSKLLVSLSSKLVAIKSPVITLEIKVVRSAQPLVYPLQSKLLALLRP